MKPRQKWLLWIGLALAGCALLLRLCLPDGDKPVQTGNLLENSDFSMRDSDGDVAGWYTDAYIHTAGYTDYTVEDGVATIVNHALNDARFAQDVSVEPDSLYCLSGWIRADADSGRGANLSVSDVYAFSQSVYDSEEEWVEVRLYGRTGEKQKKVTVFARLGGYSGEAVGAASFRDLKLEQVSRVPDGYTAVSWDKAAYQAADAAAEDEAASAWPWLTAVALLYLALCAALYRAVMTDAAAKTRRGDWLIVGGMLLTAGAARIAVALMIPGYGTDVGCFTAWANAMAENGPANFYQTVSFCDYPPGYLLVLWLFGGIGKLLGTGATEFLIKLPSIICDLAAAAALYCFARNRISRSAAFALSALYAFNPLTFAAGAAWGQSDSVMALCILLTVIFACENKWAAALPAYMLSVLMKPQALMFGPLGLAALVLTLARRRTDRRLVSQALVGLGISLAAALAVLLPFSLHMEDPFWVVDLYRGTMGYYDNATVNACNLLFLMGKNWIGAEEASAFAVRLVGALLLTFGALHAAVRFGWWRREQRTAERLAMLSCALLAVLVLAAVPMTYAAYGTCIIVLAVILCAALYVKGNDLRHLPLLGALLLLLLCNLGVMMHERYLFPAMILLALACVLERDRRVYILSALLTASVFLNFGLVLDRGVRIGGAGGHLDAPAFGINSDSAAIEYIVSALNCLLTGYAGVIGFAICWQGQTDSLAAWQNEREQPVFNAAWRAERELRHPQPMQPMKRLDYLLMLGVTAVYAAAAFVNLGAVRSPQTWWRSKTADETVVLDLGQQRNFNMLYLGGIHSGSHDFLVRTSDDGVNWSERHWAQMTEGDCFKWQYVCEVTTYGETTQYTKTPLVMTGRYVQVQSRAIATTLYEVVLRDPDTQEVFPVSVASGDGQNLIDEQTDFYGEPGWYNSTYFDEIYHARTGYEHYLAMTGDYTYYPYETSHPPLGKVLMAFSIAIFGMTPFGWRFPGALAGVLMLPGMYLLGKMLTKRRRYAFGAMFLMAVDLMHFTQTRIATIDSFAVLFIIWSMVFMVYYIRMDYWRTGFVKTLVPLALSGLFMGLAVASKWTGCYAGVGLAVLFFWSMWRRLQECLYARREMKAKSKYEAKRAETVWITASEHGLQRLSLTILCCVIFFIVVPCLIYYASYIPYFLPSGGVTAERVVRAAVGDYFETGRMGGMLGYHGEPGRGMDHPFYSPWYEWPVIGKPMWYYSSSYHPAWGTETIFAMGNPAVWWGGLGALLMTAMIWAVRHVNRRGLSLYDGKNDPRPAILLIAFAAQYFPWTLVPRGTYIYHYFPSVPFIILCAMLCLDLFSDALEKPVVLSLRGEKMLTLRLQRLPAAVTILYLLAALGLFIAFFPYASGVTTSYGWLRAMQWFSGWIYY